MITLDQVLEWLTGFGGEPSYAEDIQRREAMVPRSPVDVLNQGRWKIPQAQGGAAPPWATDPVPWTLDEVIRGERATPPRQP